jgi:hypothetical protein
MSRVIVHCDEGDLQRSCFGAMTSGQAFLYDKKGRLQFSGGISRARGRTGPNAGRQAIESLLHGVSTPIHESPVFGCPLVSDQL